MLKFNKSIDLRMPHTKNNFYIQHLLLVQQNLFQDISILRRSHLNLANFFFFYFNYLIYSKCFNLTLHSLLYKYRILYRNFILLLIESILSGISVLVKNVYKRNNYVNGQMRVVMAFSY